MLGLKNSDGFQVVVTDFKDTEFVLLLKHELANKPHSIICTITEGLCTYCYKIKTPSQWMSTVLVK
jgi:hypothetical protein